LIQTGEYDDTLLIESTIEGQWSQDGSGDDTVLVANAEDQIDEIRGTCTLTGRAAMIIFCRQFRRHREFQRHADRRFLSGLAPGVIHYQGIEDLDIDLGSGQDTFNVRSTSTLTDVVDTGGNSTFNVAGWTETSMGSTGPDPHLRRRCGHPARVQCRG